ncbi:hypothetical protein Cni_G16713 [Canna indica]|uniref:Uncharacterized protein n=1 Tax=Canna indica TaxID=4628 RepID=A0AAQ3QG43_9LILI|nr:hypothetical protein Cni_G16713 [Canna indica]
MVAWTICCEAVRDELSRGKKKENGVEEAIKAHVSFCRKSTKSNPAVRVAEGMRQMLRRRSGDLSKPSMSPKKSGRIASTTQVGDESSLVLF